MKFVLGAVAIAGLIGLGWYFFGERSAMVGGMYDGERIVVLKRDMTREAIAGAVGESLGYDETTIHQFHDTLRIMQWDTVKDVLVPHLLETRQLSESDREILFTHNTVYLDVEHDILESLYAPGTYTFSREKTVAENAEALLVPIRGEGAASFVAEHLDADAADALIAYVTSSKDLLPDLVPLPPQDVGIREAGDRRLLVFSTIYYNRGLGNLELRADPATAGIAADLERVVFQRISQVGGGYREREAGTFSWHEEHLHYHFEDFVVYRLDRVHDDGRIEETGIGEKNTFCIRDVSKVMLPDVAAKEVADYLICGKERQGISVGWGDAYFHTYADQNLDVSDLPSGTYRLSFSVNPEDRFEELTKDNNVASALIAYDRDAATAEVISTEPKQLPSFEHIHIEQDL